MKPKELLKAWERAWGPLSDAQRQSFLKRSEVADLCSLDSAIVMWAIKHNKKLAQILEVAERGRSAPRRPSGALRYTARPTGGSGGTQASYSSGLARNPGASEMPIGERCSQCDAFVPSGSVHDCT
jgi:hypothetical protein